MWRAIDLAELRRSRRDHALMAEIRHSRM